MIFYFDVQDENKLPERAFFLDPYDKEKFVVKSGESLPDFIKRVQESREAKGYQAILEPDLRQLIVDSLVISNPGGRTEKYFIQRTTVPSANNVLAFITTLAYNLIRSDSISVKQREERLNDCLDGCSFHKAPGLFNLSSSASWIVDKLTSLVAAADLTKTKYELNNVPIGNCAMCGGCKLKDKTKYSTAAVLAGLAPEALDRILAVYGPESFGRCWQLREIAQDPKLRNTFLKKLEQTTRSGVEQFKTYEESLKDG